MSNSVLYALWGVLYAVCAGLGFLKAPGEGMQFVMTVLSVALFVPAFLLNYRAADQGDKRTLKIVRNLSFCWLMLACLLLVANFLSVLSASEALGTVLHIALSIVSVPMGSSGGIISLFLWACLLYTSIPGRKKKK
jgi:uncharacterized membrane protein SirB2